MGRYSSVSNNAGSTLVCNNAGAANETFVLTNADGSQATFYGLNSLINTPGKLQTWADRYGSKQTYAWENLGGNILLNVITDSSCC